MKKIFYAILICLLLISIFGCSEKPVKNSSSESMRTSQHDTNKYSLIDQQAKDVDGDGSADQLRLQSFFDKGTNSYIAKLSINNQNKITKFTPPARFDAVSKMFFVELPDHRQGILIKFFNTESGLEQEETPSSYDLSLGCMVFGFSGDQIWTLLDTESMPFNRNGNYDIKHLNDYDVEFIDKSTNFKVWYKIYYDEALKSEYSKRLKSINDFKIPDSMAQTRYYNIRTIDTREAVSSQLVLSKVIPGIYHNDVLGVLDYHYEFKNDKYALTKEVLTYNRVLDLPPIKEMKF